MCTDDIVIDTNILIHANGGGGVVAEHESALEVLLWLSGTDATMWVLDDQGKRAPDLSTSVLASEYYQSLPPQSFGMVLLANFLATGRVSFSRRPNQETAKTIRRLLPRNTSDRAVLGAAVGSKNRVLISNDFDDFSMNVREAARKQLATEVVASTDVAA